MAKVKIILLGLICSAFLAISTLGIVSAASVSGSNNTNEGSSSIPKSVFKNDLLSAASQLLNTSSSNILSARKNHTLDQLIKNAGYNRRQFVLKVRGLLVSELKSQGYSASQITIALQHREIIRLRRNK